MDKQELQKEIEKARIHLANMEKMLAECEHERWKPEKHETYYFVNSECEVYETWRSSINFIPDKKRYNVHNCFQTREQAEAEAEKILVRRMLEDIARRLNKGKKINWMYDKNKYFIYLDDRDTLTFGIAFAYKIQGTIYCSDENFLSIAKSEIGEERLKKYLRGE